MFVLAFLETGIAVQSEKKRGNGGLYRDLFPCGNGQRGHNFWAQFYFPSQNRIQIQYNNITIRILIK
jgi:hypothetical protein